MVEVTGRLLLVLTLLREATGALEPSAGFCLGNECFTVFRHPADYSSAQERCKERGGHLMSVRSSSAQDSLALLLGNFSGRFWIGLRLHSGCPDATAALRGFQWAAGDGGDFSNWLPAFDSSCSARCVSVSPEEDFKWSPGSCHDDSAGFLCEHGVAEPCAALPSAGGDTVIYKTTLGFEAEGLSSAPPGSTAVRMPAETMYVCFSQQWLQAPWSCEIHEGGCEHRCAVGPHNQPICYCPRGQTVHEGNKVTCEVAAEDPCVDLGCMHACYKQGGAFLCVCDHGYKLAPDGKSCVDFNDCMDARQCPGDNFRCVNTEGGFQCVCEDGYRLSGGLCVDVDECMSAPCEHICTNTAGSFSCSCYPGYREDPLAPRTCRLYCGRKECVAECDPNDVFQCFCPEGYILEERTGQSACIDIDECAFSYCDQECTNTYGSYQCACFPGYALVDQYKCVKHEDDTETDGGSEGSGSAGTFPPFPPAPRPWPTRRPAGVSAGAFAGIILSTVFLTVLLVFLIHHALCGGDKSAPAAVLKAPEGETHGARHDSSDV